MCSSSSQADESRRTERAERPRKMTLPLLNGRGAVEALTRQHRSKSGSSGLGCAVPRLEGDSSCLQAKTTVPRRPPIAVAQRPARLIGKAGVARGSPNGQSNLLRRMGRSAAVGSAAGCRVAWGRVYQRGGGHHRPAHLGMGICRPRLTVGGHAPGGGRRVRPLVRGGVTASGCREGRGGEVQRQPVHGLRHPGEPGLAGGDGASAETKSGPPVSRRPTERGAGVNETPWKECLSRPARLSSRREDSN
jgi:hypothetical protein